MTLSAVRSAGAAAAYYAEIDDYYKEGDRAPTRWQGVGAKALGLHGAVQTRDAAALLHGLLPNGEILGHNGAGGEREHRAGWDATFSAPKSVSVAALVHGEARLLAAHDHAVRVALEYLEQHAAATRIRSPEGISTQSTGNLVIATYRHSINREAEPQLHTHGVIANTTRDAAGCWRSLESRPLYRLQIEAGEVYRNELARVARELGYTIERTQAGGHASFELKEVSAAERAQFSSRSAQIEAALAARGQDRASATAREKETATLDSRKGKTGVDHAVLREQWRIAAREAGHRLDLPPGARIDDGHAAAVRNLRDAAEQLGERQARFAGRELLATARRLGLGQASEAELRAAMVQAATEGALVTRVTRAYDVITGQRQAQAGFATRNGLKTEQKMLALADAAVGCAAPMASRIEAEAAIFRQEHDSGHRFTAGQREATLALLSGTDRVALLQGYAGTAKTTSVMASTANELRRQGWQVEALAPTHQAAEILGCAIGAQGRTVASLLHQAPTAPPERANRDVRASVPRMRMVYLVDEASLLSAGDMTRLLQKTGNARLVLLGDVKQLGSVEAGAAFRQLQQSSPLKTIVLDTIVRQKDAKLRAAVYDALAGDPAAALAKVEIRALESRADRVAAMARDYAVLLAEERARTLVIAPGRDDRVALNMAIRAELAAREALQGPEVLAMALERLDLTRVQARQISAYHDGDQLRADRHYPSLGLAKGESARVVGLDLERQRLVLERTDGQRVEIDPARYTRFSAWAQRELPLKIGDRITLREGAATLKAGLMLTVERVHADSIQVRESNGQLHTFDLSRPLALDYAYAQTAHQAQGSTCTRVLIHAESDRVNLMTQQSLYVALSRATHDAIVYTDDQLALVAQITRETGQKETALQCRAEVHPTDRAFVESAPWETVPSNSRNPAEERSRWLEASVLPL